MTTQKLLLSQCLNDIKLLMHHVTILSENHFLYKSDTLNLTGIIHLLHGEKENRPNQATISKLFGVSMVINKSNAFVAVMEVSDIYFQGT